MIAKFRFHFGIGRAQDVIFGAIGPKTCKPVVVFGRCLGRGPFDEFPAESGPGRLQLLLFSILDLFGFIRDHPPTAGSVAGVSASEWPQFIHCTGGMLVTVPQLGALEQQQQQTRGSSDKHFYRDYIIRQCQVWLP